MPLLRYPHRLYRVYRLYRRYRALGIRIIPRLRPPELPIDCLRCRTRCNPLFAGRRYCPDCAHRIDQSKRRWFQLHLSTCLILSLLIGTLLGVNLLPQCERRIDGESFIMITDGSEPVSLPDTVSKYPQLGWPCSYWARSEETRTILRDDDTRPSEASLISEIQVRKGAAMGGRQYEHHIFFCRYEPTEYFETKLLIYDFIVCLAIATLSAIALEWAARRSDRIAFVRRYHTLESKPLPDSNL